MLKLCDVIALILHNIIYFAQICTKLFHHYYVLMSPVKCRIVSIIEIDIISQHFFHPMDF